MFPTEGEVTTLGSTSSNGSSSEPSGSSSGAFESSTGELPICHGEPVGVWEAIPDAPESRYVATGVWTGQEVLVWGGLKDFESDFASQGLRYEPATKIWDFISDVDAPIGRSSHVAIWTGSEMFVWGGAITVGERPNTTFNFFADGGRYDPLTDTWKGVSELDAPTARIHHRVVWTGDRVLIWGGNNYNEGHTVNTGGSYDPVLDAWKAISLEGAPSPRDGHAVVWTGQEMFVWGGTGLDGTLGDGGLYDPSTDTWRPVSTIGQPAPLRLPFGAWTGEHVLIYSTFSLYLTEEVGVLHRYDPAQDLWLPEIVLCDQRAMASLAWTGSDILAWGGFLQCGEEGCPVADNILRIPPGGGDVSANAPGQPDYRSSHVYLWIDGGLWVWGGTAPNPVATGGVYWPGS